MSGTKSPSETDPQTSPLVKEQLVEDLKNLGLQKGDLLHAKISLRAIGRIDGGAATLLAAILEVIGPEGTLVSDSFIPMYPLPLTAEQAENVAHDQSPTYAGAFCRSMVQHPDMVRSQHPVQKGVAIGARASDLMLNHTDQSPAYDPLHRMALEGAKHITIGKDVVGVGTTHVAQNLLELKQDIPKYGLNYRNSAGEVVLFEINWVGGCGNGFPKFFPLYEKGGGILVRGPVGAADSMITDMKKTLDIELATLAETPAFFFCDDPGCTYCRLSWEFSTGKEPIVLLSRFLKSWRQKSAGALLMSVKSWLKRRLGA